MVYSVESDEWISLQDVCHYVEAKGILLSNGSNSGIYMHQKLKSDCDLRTRILINGHQVSRR